MGIEDEIRAIVRSEIRAALTTHQPRSDASGLQRMVADEVRRQIDLASVDPVFAPYEPTWTTKQAAEFLGISAKTLYNGISQGTFPRPKKHGRLNAFVPSEVAEARRQMLGLDEVTFLPHANTGPQ